MSNASLKFMNELSRRLPAMQRVNAKKPIADCLLFSDSNLMSEVPHDRYAGFLLGTIIAFGIYVGVRLLRVMIW
jgi:hypothetical protein